MQEMLTVIQEVSFSECHFPPSTIMCVFSTLLSDFTSLCLACMLGGRVHGEPASSGSNVSQSLDGLLLSSSFPVDSPSKHFATVLRSILNILFKTKYKRSDHLQSIKIPWLFLHVKFNPMFQPNSTLSNSFLLL